MRKINNVVIENQSPEFAVELKKFWDGVEIKETGCNLLYGHYRFIATKLDRDIYYFYGIINGKFDNYKKSDIPPHVQIFDHIPTLAELGLEEEVEFPCEMEVWEDGESASNATIVANFEHLGKKRYVEYVEQGDIYVVWSNARPLPKTLPLTLTELLTIASEVKGVKVTLKEEDGTNEC